MQNLKLQPDERGNSVIRQCQNQEGSTDKRLLRIIFNLLSSAPLQKLSTTALGVTQRDICPPRICALFPCQNIKGAFGNGQNFPDHTTQSPGLERLAPIILFYSQTPAQEQPGCEDSPALTCVSALALRRFHLISL